MLIEPDLLVNFIDAEYTCIYIYVYVKLVGWFVDLGFNVPPTAKIIWRRDHDLLSNPID